MIDDVSSSPNVFQPASGDSTDKGGTSAFGSFLKHFGGNKKTDPQPPSQNASDFASSLNENDQSAASPFDTSPAPSMEGAQVVSEPSPMASEPPPTQQPEPFSQEPVTAFGNLGSSTAGPTVDFNNQPSLVTEPSAATPDLSGIGVQATNIPGPGGAEARAAALNQAKNTLEDVAGKVQDALENIDAALGVKPADAGTEPTPQEPVGLKF